MDQGPSVADWGSLLLSGAALVVAILAWSRSDRNTSAGTLISLYEGFREGWKRYLKAKSADKDDEFADLINLFEIACAIHQDKSVHGASREILEQYLLEGLALIEGNDRARASVLRLREQPETFKYLIKFLVDQRRRGRSQPAADLLLDR